MPSAADLAPLVELADRELASMLGGGSSAMPSFQARLQKGITVLESAAAVLDALVLKYHTSHSLAVAVALHKNLAWANVVVDGTASTSHDAAGVPT